MNANRDEGYVNVPGGRVWYRIAGSGDGLPLLALHGGPGMPSDYLSPLEALGDERPVVRYDQLGCGESDQPDDIRLWQLGRFVDELRTVRTALGLDRFHLLGHSWGSMLGVEYALTRPEGLVSLILAGPCLSVRRWLEDVERYRAALPESTQRTLDVHEAAGTIDSPEYVAATMVFYKRHFCRLDPWPDNLQRTWDRIGFPVYVSMWGPTEFTQTGNLRDFERVDRLHEIHVPTLFTCGRYDEASPEATAMYAREIPGSEVVVFENSSHTPHIEEETAYIETVRSFLRRTEKP
jgi:proline-specific peptidase